ncbi:MAG: TfoX/Sxy family protein [Hyphomonadaceae bacterium]|nr:TfoX/Sxy family protein [Hyphomonadaceae bacterium]
MAKSPDPFHEFVRELFAPLGPVTIKRMFGGAGVYAHEVMFGLIAQDQLYLKVDDALKVALEEEGSEPFRYEKKTGEVAVMAYYALPDAATGDPEAASAWGRRALNVALKAKTRNKRKPRG